LKWLIKLVTKYPLYVLAGGFLAVAAAFVWGLSVFGHLSGGGFDDPNSSSFKANNTIAREFPSKHNDFIVLFTTTTGSVRDPAVSNAIKADLAKIAAAPGVSRVVSFYSLPAPNFISKDARQTYALITLTSKQSTTLAKLQEQTPDSATMTVQYGGEAAVNEQINTQTKADLGKAEALSFPILGILLLIIFRSVVAAVVPLALGGLSILFAFLIVRGLTLFTDISIYAINIITLMGLGLAIDYSLFIVSRFREELAAGHEVDEALGITLRTAGRTILFSGLTVILSLLGLLVFHQSFLRSMGLGGAAAVMATVIISMTVLPAALRLLGHRINAWGIPGLSGSLGKPAGTGIWYRYSDFIMRYPLVTLGAALELLVILGLPFLSAHFTTPDATTIPANLSSRQVHDALIDNFVGAGQSPVIVVAHTPGNTSAPETQTALAAYMKSLDGVSGVTGTSVTAKSEHYYEIDAAQDYAPQSDDARQVVRDVRSVAVPAGWQVETNGQSAALVDLLASLRAGIPWAALIIVISTSTLLFLMLGSVVIPIKAIILNVLSLSAAFGLMAWVFQDGHLATTFGLTSNGSLDATQPILIFAIAFGLAMDYELFLLSRVKEEYDRTGDNTHSVAVGVQRTAGIITSAALMLVVVIGLFATGKISIIQQVGVGLGAAVAIDATIVRMILVPTAMRLLGRFNWWAPAPLAALARRLGIRD